MVSAPERPNAFTPHEAIGVTMSVAAAIGTDVATGSHWLALVVYMSLALAFGLHRSR